MYKEGDNIQI